MSSPSKAFWHHSRPVFRSQAVKKRGMEDLFKNQENGEQRATALSWDRMKSLSALHRHHHTFLTHHVLQTLGLSYADPVGVLTKWWPEETTFLAFLLRSPPSSTLYYIHIFFSFLILLSNFFSITQTSLPQGTAFEPPPKLMTREAFKACACPTARLQVQTDTWETVHSILRLFALFHSRFCEKAEWCMK